MDEGKPLRLRCQCLVINGPDDLEVQERDAGELGPGEVLVRVGFGGICGSDLHYFHDGGFGTVRIKRPMILGHEVAGTVGGGHLELKAISVAREMLAAGATAAVEHNYPLGPALGQCCGGGVVLRTVPLDAQALARWPASTPLFTLQLYGAGHVGRAIVHLLSTIDCSVSWIDEREAEFPAEPSPPHIQRLCVEPVEAEVRLAAPGSFFLVLTHSHALDMAISEAILRRADFGYFGLIGSATKRAQFMRRLADRGMDVDTLARMTCPIGMPGIEGKEPELIAVAVVAQLLQRAAAGQGR